MGIGRTAATDLAGSLLRKPISPAPTRSAEPFLGRCDDRLSRPILDGSRGKHCGYKNALCPQKSASPWSASMQCRSARCRAAILAMPRGSAEASCVRAMFQMGIDNQAASAQKNKHHPSESEGRRLFSDTLFGHAPPGSGGPSKGGLPPLGDATRLCAAIRFADRDFALGASARLHETGPETSLCEPS